MSKNAAGTGQAVLISGATTGIGYGCANQLAQAGYTIFAGFRKTEDKVRLQALSPRIIPVQLDLTDHDTIREARLFLEDHLNTQSLQLAGIVNNAGILIGGPLEFISPEAIRLQLEVNLIGHMAITQTLLPLLRSQPQTQTPGRIINISSVSGLISMPFIGPYCISKFALEAWSDALRVELRPWKIPVISLQPGSIATPIWQKSHAKLGELASEAPSDLSMLYDNSLNAMRKASLKSENRGIPDTVVAKAVLRALTTPRPKARYLVGPDAGKYRWLRMLPKNVLDRIITAIIGLP